MSNERPIDPFQLACFDNFEVDYLTAEDLRRRGIGTITLPEAFNFVQPTDEEWDQPELRVRAQQKVDEMYLFVKNETESNDLTQRLKRMRVLQNKISDARIRARDLAQQCTGSYKPSTPDDATHMGEQQKGKTNNDAGDVKSPTEQQTSSKQQQQDGGGRVVHAYKPNAATIAALMQEEQQGKVTESAGKKEEASSTTTGVEKPAVEDDVFDPGLLQWHQKFHEKKKNSRGGKGNKKKNKSKQNKDKNGGTSSTQIEAANENNDNAIPRYEEELVDPVKLDAGNERKVEAANTTTTGIKSQTGLSDLAPSLALEDLDSNGDEESIPAPTPPESEDLDYAMFEPPVATAQNDTEFEVEERVAHVAGDNDSEVSTIILPEHVPKVSTIEEDVAVAQDDNDTRVDVMSDENPVLKGHASCGSCVALSGLPGDKTTEKVELKMEDGVDGVSSNTAVIDCELSVSEDLDNGGDKDEGAAQDETTSPFEEQAVSDCEEDVQSTFEGDAASISQVEAVNPEGEVLSVIEDEIPASNLEDKVPSVAGDEAASNMELEDKALSFDIESEAPSHSDEEVPSNFETKLTKLESDDKDSPLPINRPEPAAPGPNPVLVNIRFGYLDNDSEDDEAMDISEDAFERPTMQEDTAISEVSLDATGTIKDDWSSAESTVADHDEPAAAPAAAAANASPLANDGHGASPAQINDGCEVPEDPSVRDHGDFYHHSGRVERSAAFVSPFYPPRPVFENDNNNNYPQFHHRFSTGPPPHFGIPEPPRNPYEDSNFFGSCFFPNQHHGGHPNTMMLPPPPPPAAAQYWPSIQPLFCQWCGRPLRASAANGGCCCSCGYWECGQWVDPSNWRWHARREAEEHMHRLRAGEPTYW